MGAEKLIGMVSFKGVNSFDFFAVVVDFEMRDRRLFQSFELCFSETLDRAITLVNVQLDEKLSALWALHKLNLPC